MLSSSIGLICYFTAYFIVHCYVNFLGIHGVWVKCIVTVSVLMLHWMLTLLLAVCLYVMAGLSDCQIFVLSVLLCPLVCFVLSFDS